MAVPADVAEKGLKSFMNTMKEVGTDRAISDALIGGAAGIGLNMGANVVSGDSGGYAGAGILGGAAGGFGRAGLKHFNLEQGASKLFSTFKEGAVGGLTKSKGALGLDNTGNPGQVMRNGKNEYSIPQYRKAQDEALAKSKSYAERGMPAQAQEEKDLATNLGVTRKENVRKQRDLLGLKNTKPEKTSMTTEQINAQKNSPEAKALRGTRAKKAKANARQAAVSKYEDLQVVKGMGKSDTPLLGYNPDAGSSPIPMGYGGDAKPSILDRTQHSKFPNSFGVSDPTPRAKQNIAPISGGSSAAYRDGSFLTDNIRKNSGSVVESPTKDNMLARNVGAADASMFNYKTSLNARTKESMTKTLNNGQSLADIRAAGAAEVSQMKAKNKALSRVESKFAQNSKHIFGG